MPPAPNTQTGTDKSAAQCAAPIQTAASLVIGYVVNQYPRISHSFIRREIAALEELGIGIRRYSIRPPPEPLTTSADLAEERRTRTILNASLAVLAAATIGEALAHPLRFGRALAAALRLGRRSGRGLLRHLAYLAEACIVRRWCRDDRVDHVHAHFGTNSTTVALLCRLLGGPPYSFTAHGPEEFLKAGSLGMREKIDRAAFVIAVTEDGARRLHEISGLPADDRKVRIIRCGLDPSFLAEQGTPVPSAPRIVSVGRLCPEKRQDLLIAAVGRLVRRRKREVELVIIGDGEMRPQIERAIAAEGVAANVRLIGWGSEADVRREIVAARALVMSSDAEGLPVVIMEAFALGRPVVSTSVYGVPELVDPGVSGWLVPRGDADALSHAIGQVLDADPRRLEAMARAGRARVRKRHDARLQARELATLWARTGDVN